MKRTKVVRNILIALIGLLSVAQYSQAQMLVPHRAKINKPETAIFKAPSVILMPSVKNLYAKTLNMSIYHTFGIVRAGVRQFWGLDSGANVRLGLDYGITNNLSVGIGRTSISKVVDGRFKYSLLHQMSESGSPIELAVNGDLGINTGQRIFQGSYGFNDRLGYSFMLMGARKFNDQLSLQVAPMITHYNRVNVGKKTYYGIGLSGRYKITGHTALALEYVPVFNKTNSMQNELSIAFNIETGGHVFQLFFTNAQSFNPQGILSQTHNKFMKGYFRFGFNINRIFWFTNKHNK